MTLIEFLKKCNEDEKELKMFVHLYDNAVEEVERRNIAHCIMYYLKNRMFRYD